MAASLSGVSNLQILASDGTLAASHRLYTYATGTTTHKAAYTTAVGNVSHSYTADGLGGQYIALDVRGELPAPLFFTSGAYDLCLKTPAGATVWTRYASGTADGADYSSTSDVDKGDALIGVKSALTGGTARTQHDKNADTVSVADFGAAPGSSAVDNLAGIATAVASGAKIIRFPGGTYSLGTLNSSATSFAVTGSGIRFVADGLVTFSFAYGANSTQPIIFGFTGCDSIRFDGRFAFVDSVGYNGTTIHGVKALRLNQTNTNFAFEDVHLDGCLSGIEVVGTADSRSVKGIRAKVTATGVYYVVNHQQNGDDAIYDIFATNCRREFFFYGCRDIRAKVTMVNHDISATALLTSYEVYTNKTEDIAIDLTAIWPTSPQGPCMYMTHQPTTAGGITAGIRNVTVKYNVISASASGAIGIGVVNLSAAVNGGATITTNCNCVTDYLHLEGSTNGSYVYDMVSEYTLTAGNTKGRASWPYNARFDLSALKVLSPGRSFVWTPAISGVGWAIGNGSTEGRYTLMEEGQVLQLWGKITFGSSSTFGSGAALSVDLPVMAFPWTSSEGSFNSGHPSDLTMVGIADIFDTSAPLHYTVPVKTGATTGANLVVLHGIGAGGYVTNTVPMTFASGDTIQFTATLVRNNVTALAP
jgi:hypothetical protein